MAVFAERLLGTIGGGHIAHEAMTLARAALKGDALPPEKRFAVRIRVLLRRERS